MSPILINLVGVAAAFCSMTSFVPQVIKIWREKQADAVSLRMYVVTATGFALWAAYGFAQHAWPLVGSNLVCLTLALAILGLKLHYDGRQRKRAAGLSRGPRSSNRLVDQQE